MLKLLRPILDDKNKVAIVGLVGLAALIGIGLAIGSMRGGGGVQEGPVTEIGAERAELNAAEEATLTSAEQLEDGAYRIPIEAAKTALVANPELLSTAFEQAGGSAPTPSSDPLVAQGEQLFQAKICFTCHSTDGSPLIGPTLKDLFGRQEKLADGTDLVVDDAYIRESILDPNAKTVEGFVPGMMPPVLAGITDDELTALVAYIRTFSPDSYGGDEGAQDGEAGGDPLMEQGAALFQSKICFTCHSTDGSALIGPTFKGLLGRAEELDDGTKITVDAGYIRESIADPAAKTVKGFVPGMMPPVLGGITDDELTALVTYISSFQ
jgi:cytochrome c2